MPKFTAVVIVECETEEQANQVLAERLAHDEDYGFDYEVNHTLAEYDDDLNEAK
jgi:hypothetical protein